MVTEEERPFRIFNVEWFGGKMNSSGHHCMSGIYNSQCDDEVTFVLRAGFKYLSFSIDEAPK